MAPLPKADCEPQRFVRELRGVYEGAEVGQVLTVDVFEGVEFVDVTGTTKGRGTAGVMKRHGFTGQRASHGVKKVHRHQGGTGQNTSPARCSRASGWPAGTATSGRRCGTSSSSGSTRSSNLLLIRGAVPGPNGSL